MVDLDPLSKVKWKKQKEKNTFTPINLIRLRNMKSPDTVLHYCKKCINVPPVHAVNNDTCISVMVEVRRDNIGRTCSKHACKCS